VEGLPTPGTAREAAEPAPVVPKTCVLAVEDVGVGCAGTGAPPKTWVRPAAGCDSGSTGFGGPPKT